MEKASFNRGKAEAFSKKMVDLLNAGALALMSSIGHRTGLFDTMAKMPPSTSEQIAENARLNERYVREWLAAMVTGRLIDYDPVAMTYFLPPEHAAFLTREAGLDNLATFAQYVPMIAGVEDEIVDCFKGGGGVAYENYSRFHQVMAEDSALTVAASLVERVVPLATGVQDALTHGVEVLDVGCGSGNAVLQLAEAFPKSRFTGYDFSPEAIATAKASAERRRVANVCFEVKDVALLSQVEQFALITAFDAIHDQAKPAIVLSAIARALLPGGTFLMQDVRASSHLHKNMDHPIAPFLYTISTMHCMPVSLALGGDGLGTMWGRELAEKMLLEAGFKSIDVHTLDHDTQNFYYIARKT